nr:quinolinate synthase NadA [uncultured Desulfobacter sp.]
MNTDLSSMTKQELSDFINTKKEELGNKVRVIGYPGQFDDLLQFADFFGDAEQIKEYGIESNAQFLMFTGWRFFTDIPVIFQSGKKVIQSNIKNDCPIADHSSPHLIKEAFKMIQENNSTEVVPLGFVAASSELRSFCGEHNGSVCMPWNAYKVIKHYLDQNKSIFFIPANDAFNIITALNLPDDQIYVVDSTTDFKNIPGGKKIYAWNVECFVHKKYTVDDIKNLREKYQDQGIKIIAHKECAEELKDLCDDTGFVGEIYEKIKKAPSGSCLGVVTVDTWVSRAAYEFSDKTIVSPRTDLVCGDLRITNLTDVAKSFQSIVDYENGDGALVSEHIISDDLIDGARKAYETMFTIDQRAS